MRQPKNKESITQAGIRLFCQKGFADASIKEIADAAGVSPGNIYNYFKSKNELFEYLFALNFPGNHIELLVKGISEDKGSDENIAAAFENIIKYINTNPYVFKLMLVDANEFGGKHLASLSEPFIKPIGEYLQPSATTALNLRRDIEPLEITAFLSWMFYAMGTTDLIIKDDNGEGIKVMIYKVLLKILQKGLKET
jgi:AcrR family transcriptional regulator